jgi:hypothetical protein
VAVGAHLGGVLQTVAYHFRILAEAELVELDTSSAAELSHATHAMPPAATVERTPALADDEVAREDRPRPPDCKCLASRSHTAAGNGRTPRVSPAGAHALALQGEAVVRAPLASEGDGRDRPIAGRPRRKVARPWGVRAVGGRPRTGCSSVKTDQRHWVDGRCRSSQEAKAPR